jgi:hypothetical protein
MKKVKFSTEYSDCFELIIVIYFVTNEIIGIFIFKNKMPTFFTFDGITINLYFNDHLPPHFHAIYAEHEALISIYEIKLIKGSLPKRKLKGS